MNGRGRIMEVKEDAEEQFVRDLDGVLDETVFSAGCSNWYINKAGRNAAAWPGLASSFWQATFWPKWNDFEFSDGSYLWPLRWALGYVSARSATVTLTVAAIALTQIPGAVDMSLGMEYVSKALKLLRQ